MGKNAVLEAGLLLESVARKIRKYKGDFTDLEFRIIRLHIETALQMLPNPPRPGEAPAHDDAAASKVRNTRKGPD